jgi:hypothetical protein
MPIFFVNAERKGGVAKSWPASIENGCGLDSRETFGTPEWHLTNSRTKWELQQCWVNAWRDGIVGPEASHVRQMVAIFRQNKSKS